MALLLIIVCLALLAAAGATGSAKPQPTGHWRLSLTIDYESTATATAASCHPPQAIAPNGLSGTVTDTIRVRTLRAPVVEFHEAPNGVPVAMESNYTKAFRGRVSETRRSTLDAGGEPQPCSGPAAKTDCGTKSASSGLYLNPLGGIRHWKGFTLELQAAPSFQGCGLTDANAKLDSPLGIDVVASPKQLTSRRGKLVFRGSGRDSGKAKRESTSSTASGEVRWKVVLVRAGAGA